MALADEKYVLLTTFKRSGDPVATPVWLVALDGGMYGFWTSSGSGKAKRLAHTNRITVQPCDARGKITEGSAISVGSAVLVTGAELDEIRTKIVAKYGLMTKITKLLGTIGGIVKRNKIPYGDSGVKITIDG